MEQITNDLPRFENQIQEFSGALNNLKAEFEEMSVRMGELNGMWTGEAHDEFLRTFGEDARKVRSMLEYMEILLSNLNYADDEYRNCEQTVRNMIDQLNV